ncbi:MAG TPA: methionine synthase [Acidimicrobiales bacterium]|nr:methionine synthase [Acidimicrobiales bacterium]
MDRYLEAARQRVVVFDGASGTSLQAANLSADDFGGPELEGCNEVLVETRPEVAAAVHAGFLDVGVDVIETHTFGAFSVVLAEYGIAERAYQLNLAAARLAREVASGYSTPDRPRWVAGSMGPGTKLPSLGHISFADLRDAYEEQARGLLDGGVDLLLVETQYDLLAAKAGLLACRRAMQATGRQVPLQVQVTMETTGRMLVGSEIGAALTALSAMRPDVIGLNCATGPREMGEHLRYLSRHSPVPISCLPNAGLPSVVDGRTHYDLTPEQLAEHHAGFITELGVTVVGGCCGTTPDHLRAVVEACRHLEPARRQVVADPGVASIYSHTPYDQSPSVLIVGERANTNGSKQFKQALLNGDWDTCVALARDQVREGAHVLDLCVDYTGRDGTADMDAVARRWATEATAPIMLDSTEPQVVEAGLQWIGGKPLLNSANLEEGEAPGQRFDRVMSMARDYGCAVVCMCIDETGQARTAERKLEIARRIRDIAVERYGLDPADLFFDTNTLTITTGMEESRRDALETIEGIRAIKTELAGVHTSLGVSNVSFGLKPAARHVLNSVFLHEAQQAGLDAAMVNPARIMPLNRIDPAHVEICLDLIYDRRREGYDPLAELLAAFEDVTSAAAEREDRSSWPVEERLKARIIDGDRNGLEADLDQALAEGRAALDIVNDVLLDGMKVVGELFGSGRMQLPFVLQSAETMKSAVAYLEPHMERAESGGKGRIVLATVKGDVHDIGKNLVDIILTNNGYEVHNLGIKVPLEDMVAKADEVGADAIGMSGLLVKSTLIMRENLEELNRRGLSGTPVLLGGAALTRSYVERDLRSVYEGRVFYGRDAFEGLRTMDRLMELKRSGEDDADFGRKLTERIMPERKSEQDAARAVAVEDLPARSPEVAADNPVFPPPFVGARVVRGIAIDDIAAYLNETALFRNQWQYRPDKDAGESDEEFRVRVRAVLRQELDKAKASGVLVPQVAYGYFAVNAEGDDLVVWKDETRTAERLRFSFPRQRHEPFLCIADFFRSADSGEEDWAAFHLVTMGPKVSEETARLFAANRYLDYVHLHGLGVEMAEALAEYWHRRIREEWGFAGEDGPSLGGLFRQQYRGGRYSWGYPACPDLEDNARVAELLEAERIGVEVSEGFQLHPEQSTLAIICHHPQAKYFVAR